MDPRPVTLGFMICSCHDLLIGSSWHVLTTLAFLAVDLSAAAAPIPLRIILPQKETLGEYKPVCNG
jgi:hypothetical protein